MKGRYLKSRSPTCISQPDDNSESAKANKRHKTQANLQSKSKPQTPVFPSQLKYIWDSSISQKWVDLAGQSRFQKIGKHQGRSTMDFLLKTQKYIYNIYKPNRPETTVASVKCMFAQVASKGKSEDITRREDSIKASNEIELPFDNSRKCKGTDYLLAKLWPAIEKRKRSPSGVKRQKYERQNVENHGIRPKRPIIAKVYTNHFAKANKDDYLITKYSLPKGFTNRRKFEEEEIESPFFTSRNRKIDRFLGRFAKKTNTLNPPPSRKGPNGWKLSKKYLQQKNHSNFKALSCNTSPKSSIMHTHSTLTLNLPSPILSSGTHITFPETFRHTESARNSIHLSDI